MARKSEYQTKNRSIIKDYLKKNKNRTVTARDIYNHVEELGNEINFTTIYRYLEKLEEEGTLHKYASKVEKEMSYNYMENAGNNKCLHMKCIQCKKIIHIESEEVEEVMQSIIEKYNFRIVYEDAILYIVCGECEKNSLLKEIPGNGTKL